MRKIKAIAAASALAVLFMPLSAFAAHYQVTAEVRSNETLHALPSFIVESGETADLSSPQDGYSLSFTPSAAGPNNVKVEATLMTEEGEMAPTVIVPVGQRASVSVGELELKFTVERVGL